MTGRTIKITSDHFYSIGRSIRLIDRIVLMVMVSKMLGRST